MRRGSQLSSRHHYVSQFHLRGFTELALKPKHDPALWVGDCATGKTYRRSPRNLAWSRGMFEGPGGLADRTSSLETFLSTEVEGPAATALAKFAKRPVGRRSSIPPELFRYICWAAARSLSMQQLFETWIQAMSPSGEPNVVEPPPAGYEQARHIERLHRMKDTDGSIRDGIPSGEVVSLREKGWQLCVGPDDFLELAHMQA